MAKIMEKVASAAKDYCYSRPSIFFGRLFKKKAHDKKANYSNTIISKNGITALMRAVFARNLDDIINYAPKFAKYQDKLGFTAMMYAVNIGFNEAVRVLLRYEAKVKNNSGNTALMIAIYNNNVEAVKILAPKEKGILTPQGYTNLLSALFMGNIECAKVMLPYESRMLIDGESALMIMASTNNAECIFDELIAAEKKMHRTKDGLTALMIAAQFNNYTCVSKLVEAECCQRSNDSYTALMVSALNKSTESANILKDYEIGLKESLGLTALMIATIKKDLKIVSSLVESEACLLDKNGSFALMHAFSKYETDDENMAVIRCLLPYEKDITLGDDKKSLLSYFVSLNSPEAKERKNPYFNEEARLVYIKELIPELCGHINRDGYTALMTAVSVHDIESVKLLKNTIDVGKKSLKNGWTALMLAAYYGYEDCIEELASEEACIKANDGITALMLAAKYRHFECVDKLASYESNILDDESRSPLMYACKQDNNDAIVQRLLKTTTRDVEDKEGVTALDVARILKQQSYVDAIEKLLH